MERDELLSLTGRVLLSSQTLTLLEATPSYCNGPASNTWPLPGDLRLDTAIDATERSGKEAGAGLKDRRGLITATIFDGVCWKRFDASGVTQTRLFANAAQLDGLLRWMCRVVNHSAGRLCVLHPGEDDEPEEYRLEPLTAGGTAQNDPETEAVTTLPHARKTQSGQ